VKREKNRSVTVPSHVQIMVGPSTQSPESTCLAKKTWRILATARFPCMLHAFALSEKWLLCVFISLRITCTMRFDMQGLPNLTPAIIPTSCIWPNSNNSMFHIMAELLLSRTTSSHAFRRRRRIKCLRCIMHRKDQKCVEIIKHVSKSSNRNKVIKHASKPSKNASKSWKSAQLHQQSCQNHQGCMRFMKIHQIHEKCFQVVEHVSKPSEIHRKR
jgi:hypothetical protein